MILLLLFLQVLESKTLQTLYSPLTLTLRLEPLGSIKPLVLPIRPYFKNLSLKKYFLMYSIGGSKKCKKCTQKNKKKHKKSKISTPKIFIIKHIKNSKKKHPKNTKKCQKHTEIAKITPKMPKKDISGITDIYCQGFHHIGYPR
jgi:hypothetical protein